MLMFTSKVEELAGSLFLFLFQDLAVPVLHEPPDPRPHSAAHAEQLQFLVVHVA
jgi:hypothetical protein